MKILNMLNNLIFKINSQHLLKNGVGNPGTSSADGSALNSIVGFFQSILTEIVDKVTEIGVVLYRVLCKFVYFVVKICLNLVDLVMVIISELCGQASGYDMGANTNLQNSDILFKFLLNSYTLKILYRLVIYSFLLLLLITIFAIVMNQWKNATKSEDNKFTTVLKKSVESIFMMFVVPFLVIVGIVASNVVLASVVSAVNPDKNSRFSIGATIFASSTYQASWYRRYAEANEKIPILFDFNGGFYGVQNADSVFTNGKDITKEMEALKNNSNVTSGYSTFNMFRNKEFFDFAQVPDDSTYYGFYDGQFLKTKRIEYFVMADFIDYAMQCGEEFYIKNVEDVYLEAVNLLRSYSDKCLYPYIFDTNVFTVETDAKTGVKHSYIDFNSEENEITEMDIANFETLKRVFSAIKPIDKDGNEIELYKKNEDPSINKEYVIGFDESKVAFYSVSVAYDAQKLKDMGDAEVLDDYKTTEYRAYPKTTDEASGAIYIICNKKDVILKDNTDEDTYAYTSIFTPLTLYDGSKEIQFDTKKEELVTRSSTPLFTFTSSYLTSGVNGGSVNDYNYSYVQKGRSIKNATYLNTINTTFVARGAFTTEGLPTAIREDGDNIVFYRHDVIVPKNIKLQPVTSYVAEEKDGTSTTIGTNDDIFSRVLGFDSTRIESDLQMQLRAVSQINKSEFKIGEFKGGKFTLNYSFVDTPLDLTNVYDVTQVNMVLLILASGSLLKVLTYVIFGLIKRLLELTVLWFTFPAWLIRHPLSGSKETILQNSTFTMWRVRFIERVISVYALYIGLALYYVLVPAVLSVNLFDGLKVNFGANNIFNSVSPEFVGFVMNAMFVLVLFTLVEQVEGIVGDYILPGQMQTGSGLSSSGKAVFDDTLKTAKDSISYFSIKQLTKKGVSTVKNTAQDAIDLIPGSGVVGDAVNLAQRVNANRKYKRDINDFANQARRASSDADINNVIDNTEITQNINAGTAENPAYINAYQKRVRDIEKRRAARRKRVTPNNRSK